MKNIVIGVCGEGMGHATRSETLINYLIKQKYKIHIFASGRAYTYLKKKFNNVYLIKHFELKYQGNKLLNIISFTNIIHHLPKNLIRSLRDVTNLCYEIDPICIITDQEAITSVVGKNIGIPAISSSNINIVDRTKVKQPTASLLLPKLMATIGNRFSNYRPHYFVIPTFFYPKTIRQNVILTSPVIREKILKAKVQHKDHILVYHTSKTATKVLDAIQRTNHKYIVYGFGTKTNTPQITYKKFSDTEFIKDLASSKAVITGGGFSLISEAIYLKKPILSTPLVNHFEQTTNAKYLEKNKFGKYMKEINPTEINDFILSIELYKHYLDNYKFKPQEYIEEIQKLIHEFEEKHPSIKYKLFKIYHKSEVYTLEKLNYLILKPLRFKSKKR